MQWLHASISVPPQSNEKHSIDVTESRVGSTAYFHALFLKNEIHAKGGSAFPCWVASSVDLS